MVGTLVSTIEGVYSRVMAKTKQSAFRLTAADLSGLDELADLLGVTRAEAVRLAVVLARQRFGLQHQDVVAAVEAIARMDGDDAEVTVTITDWTTGTANVTIAGHEAPGWTAWVLTATGEGGASPLSSSGVYLREDAGGAHFSLGLIEQPHDGASLTVPAGHLFDLMMPPRGEDRSPDQLRRDLKADFALRRRLRAALGAEPEDDHEP